MPYKKDTCSKKSQSQARVPKQPVSMSPTLKSSPKDGQQKDSDIAKPTKLVRFAPDVLDKSCNVQKRGARVGVRTISLRDCALDPLPAVVERYMVWTLPMDSGSVRDPYPDNCTKVIYITHPQTGNPKQNPDDPKPTYQHNQGNGHIYEIRCLDGHQNSSFVSPAASTCSNISKSGLEVSGQHDRQLPPTVMLCNCRVNSKKVWR